MKTQKIIYWVSTVLFALMMFMSATMYLTSPDMDKAFTHLGFPSYFRIELAVAKILGAIVLLVPAIPSKVKEWAYAGFGICFISAVVAHLSVGDPASAWISPMVAFVLLGISYAMRQRLSAALA